MKNNFLLFGFVSIIILFLLIGCEKEDKLPPNHAIGEIIAITGQCYGEVVLIEVENPNNIGMKGTFSTSNKEVKVIYENAIGVPYFIKTGIPDSIPQTVGTKLYFEFIELTDEDRKNEYLFSPSIPIICLAIYGPPSANYYIIEKVISFK